MHSQQPPEPVISFAKRFLGARDPVGARIRRADGQGVITIVGVAGDVLRELAPDVGRFSPEPPDFRRFNRARLRSRPFAWRI